MIISETKQITYGVCLDPGTSDQALLWLGPDKEKAIKTCKEYIREGAKAVPAIRCESVRVAIYEGECK